MGAKKSNMPKTFPIKKKKQMKKKRFNHMRVANSNKLK